MWQQSNCVISTLIKYGRLYLWVKVDVFYILRMKRNNNSSRSLRFSRYSTVIRFWNYVNIWLDTVGINIMCTVCNFTSNWYQYRFWLLSVSKLTDIYWLFALLFLLFAFLFWPWQADQLTIDSETLLTRNNTACIY